MTNYLHGTRPEEQERLSLMNRLMNEPALREIAVQRGERVVDFGCGLGQLTRALAKAAGHRAVGVEQSGEQLAEAARLAARAGEEHLIEFRQGDVANPPLRDAFDLAHARFVLEHVRDPLAVVRAMAKAVRSGGRVFVQDDDHELLRFWPVSAPLESLWKQYRQTYLDNGCDPEVGRKLPALLAAAGLKPVRNGYLFFGGCNGDPSWPGLIDNLIGLFESVKLQPDGVREWFAQPGAALWYAICYAEGIKP